MILVKNDAFFLDYLLRIVPQNFVNFLEKIEV